MLEYVGTQSETLAELVYWVRDRITRTIVWDVGQSEDLSSALARRPRGGSGLDCLCVW